MSALSWSPIERKSLLGLIGLSPLHSNRPSLAVLLKRIKRLVLDPETLKSVAKQIMQKYILLLQLYFIHYYDLNHIQHAYTKMLFDYLTDFTMFEVYIVLKHNLIYEV